MRYQFIKDNLSQFHIRTMCRVLGVSKSGFYSWLKDGSSKEAADERLLVKIRESYTKGRQTYGCRRIYKDLLSTSYRCSRNRIYRLMRKHKIRPRTGRSFVVTTDSRHLLPVAGNVLSRQFVVERPNRVWVSDITYVRTKEGWLYLAAVLELHSRMIVGWSMSPHLDKELAAGALRMAVLRRRPGAGLIHHSDRGCQYASEHYQDLLAKHKMVCSMSRKGNCWDNAVMESFFRSFKLECTRYRSFTSRDEARREIFEYIEVFYNRVRLHSTLGYRSPAQFEAANAA